MTGNIDMRRDDLITLLAGAGPAETACRQALQERNAEYVVYAERMAAEQLANSYARRQRAMERTGTPTVGFPEAVQALRAYTPGEVLLGSVTLHDPPIHFQLFLTPDADKVLACLGVDQRPSAGF
jgi:hypothetical protein